MIAQTTTDVQQLVVRTNRQKARHRYQWSLLLVVITHAATIGGVGAMLGLTTTHSDPTDGALIGAFGTLFAFLVGFALTNTGGLERLKVAAIVNRYLTVDAAGIWVAAPYSEAGELFLPWDALAPVVVGNGLYGKRLVLRLRHGIRPDHPGADGLWDPSLWNLLIGKGLRVGLAGTTPSVAQVVSAIERHSGVQTIRG